MFRNRFAWLLPIFWAAVIFFASSIPQLDTPFHFQDSDKLLHLLAYLPLGFLLYYAMTETPQLFTKRRETWAVLLGALYGASDEMHQYFVPGRNADFLDFAADTVGVFLGVFAFLAYLQIRKSISFRRNE